MAGSLSLLVVAVIIVLVILVIMAVAGVKVQSKERGAEMIKHVYIYLVLFATLMMTIGGSVGMFMAIADIVAPQPHFQSFEDFKRWGHETPRVPGEVPQEADLSEEELKERYNAMVATEKERQSARAKNALVKSFGWIAIPLPIFIYFQRRLARNDA